ncbi:MAG: thiamine pyrophosphate-binding protein [Candidatus Omnitrophota bacterium]
MINASRLITYLKNNGLLFYSGVPCSILQGMLQVILNDREVKYVSAVRENAALGVASGAYLAGKPSCILMQNSGLGNTINALTSFNLIYKIPVLMFITWRGFQGKDAPQHSIMGKITTDLLESLEIPYRVLSGHYKRDVDWALETMRRHSVPCALIVKKGIIG